MTVKQNEEQPIVIRETDAIAHLALQNGNLSPECGIFRLKPARRLGWQHQQSHQEDDQRDHCRVKLRDSAAGSNGRSFRHTQGMALLGGGRGNAGNCVIADVPRDSQLEAIVMRRRYSSAREAVGEFELRATRQA
jgi:hypothetical protein